MQYSEYSGTKFWRNNKDQFHRLDGPAIIFSDGEEAWYRDGEKHRLDGPAVTRSDGYQTWWREGHLHRLDGPAITRPSGHQEWWKEGKRHRLDGPAVIVPNGPRIWYHDDLVIDISHPIIHEDREVFLSEEPLTDIYPSARLVEGFTTWYHLDETDTTMFKLINTKEAL